MSENKEFRSFRKTSEYRLGLHQLRCWHEQCRCRREGVKYKPISRRKRKE